MVEHAYLIPLLPFCAAILIFFFGRWLPVKGALLGILACLVSFGISFELLMQMLDGTLPIPDCELDEDSTITTHATRRRTSAPRVNMRAPVGLAVATAS